MLKKLFAWLVPPRGERQVRPDQLPEFWRSAR
jgi:hypothetical protein